MTVGGLCGGENYNTPKTWFNDSRFRQKRFITQNVLPDIQVSNIILPDNKEINTTYSLFSHDVTVAILVYQSNETAAMLVYQENPVGITNQFLCKNLLLFQEFCIAADHVSENDL